MLLECLDAQGTFLQQFTFDSMGFPSEADGERDRGGKRGTYGGTERERKCKKIQVWRNIVKLPPARMEHLFFLFSSIRSPVSVADIIFDFSMRFFLSNY